MTAINTPPVLPPYKGEDVSRAAIKISGAGTGMSDGLKVQPIVMELDDEAYFVVRVKMAESASHFRDKNGLLVRLHRVHTEDMAPIDRDLAQNVLAEYKERIEEAKGQLLLQYEREAEERERADEAATGNARNTQTSE